jgi:hypothetical protein
VERFRAATLSNGKSRSICNLTEAFGEQKVGIFWRAPKNKYGYHMFTWFLTHNNKE